MELVKTNKHRILPSVFSEFFNSDRFFRPDAWNASGRDFNNVLPSVNIKESGKEYRLELAAPGMSKEDIDIAVENDVLTISAQKQSEKKEEKESYTRREFSYDSFCRSFRLPDSTSADKMEAKYENGILKIMVPKKEYAKLNGRKEIKIS